MEWNNGAIAIIFIMLFIPIGLFYFLIKLAIKYSPSINTFIKKEKKERVIIYILIEIGLIILSIVLTIVLFSFINYFNSGRGLFGPC